MVELVEVKVREVGNALGVILPGKTVKEENLKSGQKVMMCIFKPKKIDPADLLGWAKGALPFEREHGEHD